MVFLPQFVGHGSSHVTQQLIVSGAVLTLIGANDFVNISLSDYSIIIRLFVEPV